MNKELNEYLSGFITDKRNKLFKDTVEWRTRYITVALENIYQAQNASAVLRTCDCFGIQDVHIIENDNDYNINPDVTLGSDKWLSLTNYNTEENNTITAINNLKSKGYRIVATTPHTNDVSIDNLDLDKGKLALMFGTELNGLSPQALEHADEYVKIPMFGFTESFNISVSAAIILHTLTTKLHQNNSIDWKLSLSEKESVLLNWYKTSINNAEGIINKYFAAKQG
jgi:tRNA (guanosine-2'-O-)-methyltransferase